jgi:hypothetical protein
VVQTPGLVVDGFIIETDVRPDVERWGGLTLLTITVLTIAYILWRQATGRPLGTTL